MKEAAVLLLAIYEAITLRYSDSNEHMDDDVCLNYIISSFLTFF